MSGMAGTNGWFRSNVTIHWTVTELQNVTSSTGCELAELVTAEGATQHTCSVTFVGGSASGPWRHRGSTRRRPAASSAGTPSRGPDSNGWYNKPVAFTFAGTDAMSGIASCSEPDVLGWG